MMGFRKIIFFIIFFQSSIYAQEVNKKPHLGRVGIALNALGTTGLFGVSIDVMVAKRAMIEIGGGITGFGGGVNVFMKKLDTSKNPHFYTGLKYNKIIVIHGGDNDRVYLPLGLMLFDKNKFLFTGIDIGPNFTRHLGPGYREDPSPYPYNSFGVFGSLKVGFRL